LVLGQKIGKEEARRTMLTHEYSLRYMNTSYVLILLMLCLILTCINYFVICR
jgi:hypothetical protein